MSLFFNANDFVSDIGYPLEECGMIELMNDIKEDYLPVIESMYVMHMEKIKYDVVTENAFKTFISKIKEFFKKLWDKVKKFFAWVKSLFTKKIKDFQSKDNYREIIAASLPGLLEEMDELANEIELGIEEFEKNELNQQQNINFDIISRPRITSQVAYVSKIFQTRDIKSPIKKLPKNIQVDIISNAIKIRSFVKKESGEDANPLYEMKNKEMLSKYIMELCPLVESVDTNNSILYLKKRYSYNPIIVRNVKIY